MTDTFIFYDSSGRWKLSVDRLFLKECPEPWKHDAYELNVSYNLFQYLHNDRGPAVVSVLDGRTEYWLHGKYVSKDAIDHILFHDKIMDLIT